MKRVGGGGEGVRTAMYRGAQDPNTDHDTTAIISPFPPKNGMS